MYSGQLDLARTALERLFYAGRDAEAEKACDAVLAEVPEWPSCLRQKWDALVVRKEYAGARAALRQLATSRGAAAVRFADELMDALEGKSDARALAARLLPMPDGFFEPGSPTPLSDNDAMLWFIAAGRNADAITRFERQVRYLPHYVRLTVVDQHSDPLRCDARFQAVVKQVGFEDARAAKVCAGR